MEMRQEADIRLDLCTKYRIDLEAERNRKSNVQKKTDQFLKQMEETVR